jgi:hypothetical protein
LPQSLAALGNRVGLDERARIYASLHARIPMVTLDGQRGVQEENAGDDERFWGVMQDMNAASAEGYKGLVDSTETKLRESERRRRRGRSARSRESASRSSSAARASPGAWARTSTLSL